MANSKIENADIESLKSFELGDSSSESVIESPDMQTKLLHHLVDISKVVQKRVDDRGSEELLKANNALVSELLSTALKPMAVEAANVLPSPEATWSKILQKLIDSKVDLTDEKVKKHVYKQVDELVRSALEIQRNDVKATFVFDTKKLGKSEKKVVYTRDLTFDVTLYPVSTKWYLYVDCREIPKNMTCKVKIDATIKNHVGKSDWVRRYRNVYSEKSKQFTELSLILKEEYEDESFGFMKDGKLNVEIAIQPGELVEIKEQDKKEPSLANKTENDS